MWPEPRPADAHDARLLARQMAPSTWVSLFCKRLGLRGPCGQNHGQLMLMMLASWLANWPQAHGQFVLQASGGFPADGGETCWTSSHSCPSHFYKPVEATLHNPKLDPNPKPRTPNPKTTNPKPQTPNLYPKPFTLSPFSQALNPRCAGRQRRNSASSAWERLSTWQM